MSGLAKAFSSGAVLAGWNVLGVDYYPTLQISDYQTAAASNRNCCEHSQRDDLDLAVRLSLQSTASSGIVSYLPRSP
jgi:hypothetical protein